jgi:hypothetical protein
MIGASRGRLPGPLPRVRLPLPLDGWGSSKSAARQICLVLIQVMERRARTRPGHRDHAARSEKGDEGGAQTAPRPPNIIAPPALAPTARDVEILPGVMDRTP